MSGGGKSDRTRAAILAAARRRFAADGYERATIRAIAADAYIDPSMVMRYFGTIERLFDAAVAGAGALLPAPGAIPPDRRGEALVRWFADCWREPYRDAQLIALFKSAIYSGAAAQRLRALIEGYLTKLVPEGDRVRVAVAATQLYGAALYGCLYAAEPVRATKGTGSVTAPHAESDPDPEVFVTRLGAVVQGLLAAEC